MARKNDTNTATESTNKLAPLIIIGAGNKGNEALKQILSGLSPKLGVSTLFIRDRDQSDADLSINDLQAQTRMQVVAVANDMLLETNKVYVVPDDKELRVQGKTIKLHPRTPQAIDMPIDTLMIHSAENLNSLLIGVLLPGSSTDGILGLKAIKSAGGFTYTQNDSALHQPTPGAALEEEVVDAVLNPAAITSEIERICSASQFSMLYPLQHDNSSYADVNVSFSELTSIAPFLQLIHDETGVDFTNYKEVTIRRRIMRRMILLKIKIAEAYLDYLRSNTQEVQILYNELLINVTRFFRDPDTIEYLAKHILPKLLENKTYESPLRIWIPACSTGEEAYSLAMVIIELMGNHPNLKAVEIFATDLSNSAIKKARTGTYLITELSQVSAPRLARFFTQHDGHYRVNKAVRDMCLFAQQNVVKDPPFPRIHLISCCNLLIYFNDLLQKKTIGNFHYALNANGYLVLGKSETAGSSPDLFTALDIRVKVYQKKTLPYLLDMPEANTTISTLGEHRSPSTRLPDNAAGFDMNLDRHIDNLLLTRFARAAVVITHDLNIIQFRGSTGLFLEPSPGRASLNLVKMARPGLALELRNAVQKVIRNKEAVEKQGIEISWKGNDYKVGFTVVPLTGYLKDALLLVVFDENRSSARPEKTAIVKDRKLRQVEAELVALREDMRAIVEEQEAANAELQLANEEIVSGNEELQSVNEELETSNQELESNNEELLTINQELQMRNKQLVETQEHNEAIIALIREAVIVLDHSLRIQFVNDAFYQTFQVRKEDTEGKYLFEVHNKQWNIHPLKELLEHTLPVAKQVNGVEICYKFNNVGEKVLLLGARLLPRQAHQQQRIIIAIEDITEHRRLQRKIAEREAGYAT